MTRSTFQALVEVTLENAPSTYTNHSLAGDIRDGVFDAISEGVAGEVVVKQVAAFTPPEPVVWIGTVTDDDQPYGRPAVYAAGMEHELVQTMRIGQRVPAGLDDDSLLDWLEANHKVWIYERYQVAGVLTR
jgi:hypothetical protein